MDINEGRAPPASGKKKKKKDGHYASKRQWVSDVYMFYSEREWSRMLRIKRKQRNCICEKTNRGWVRGTCT
jgi:hypothetical protein